MSDAGQKMVEEKIGVLIQKCDLELNPLVCQLVIKISLVDCQNGENLMGPHEELATKPFHAYQQRFKSPCWDETITVNRNFKEIIENKSTKLLLLFEVNDVVSQPTTKALASGADTIRIAWAFLKPVGLNGNLNVNKELRLQLYKIRKNCSMSHQSCPAFHLYSAHEKKKYPGSLYVTVNGVKPLEASKNRPASSKATNSVLGAISMDTEVSAAENVAPNIEFSKWSRLPTQSCKLVNNKMANVAVSRRGASFVSFSHSGYQLACASFAYVVIIDTLTGKLVTKVTGHTGLIYEVTWSEDDSFLLSVSADCSAVIWSFKPLSKSPLYVLPHPSFVYSGKWLRTGYRLVTGGKDSLIRYWGKSDTGYELMQEISGHSGFITSLETHGEVMFSGDSTGCVRLWTLEDGKWVYIRKFVIKELSGTVIDTLLLHPGQRRLVVTARGRGSFMIDLSGGVIITSYKSSPMNTRSITCLSPCGTIFFAFNSKNVIHAWEFDTGKLIASYENIFPDLGYSLAELSGCIAYHPHEHMAAFAMLGFNYPVIILKYDREVDHSAKLGLTMHINEQVSHSHGVQPVEVISNRIPSATLNLSRRASGGSTEEKLAAIVRNIDKVLAAKRQMLGKLSRDTTPRD